MNIAIVGAGPVGIYLAKLCLDNDHEVTLVDSGNINEESNLLTAKNYLFRSKSAMPSGVHRIGGGSLQWHARISEFMTEDFANWPFSKSELKEHYAELYRFLEVGSLNDQEIIEKYFQSESLRLYPELKLRSFRFCDPDFFIKLFREILNNKRLRVIDGHFCIKASKQQNKSQLKLELLKKNFETTSYEFDKIVFASGTFQSTALVQRSVDPLKVRSNGLIGSNLMEHLEGYIGQITISRKPPLKFFTRLGLDEKNRALDYFKGIGVAISVNNYRSNERYFNTQFEIRRFMPGPYFFSRYKNNYKHKSISQIINVAIFFERGLRYSGRKIRQKFEFLIGRQRFSIYIKSEEFPFASSKVFLEDVSKNLVTYDHRVSDETYIALLYNLKNFQAIILDKFGIKVKFNKKVDDIQNLKDFFGANWHPMGSVRMGTDPVDSICDSNLEIHDFKNLFVVSAAVFPSGSNTNPTFTTLALARRLVLSEYFNRC